MSPDVKLTVEEILQNRNFIDAEVIAGIEGLHRTVKWVHIMEVTGIEELLNGSELILSTGVGWKENKELFLSFFQQLIVSGAAGICIELGTYISTIPEEIISTANQHQFPLIVFYRKVRFVDITQDLHTLLIKKHYKMISDLEEYSNQLNQLLLTSNPQNKILKFLYDHLKMSVIFIPKQGEIHFLSNQKMKEHNQILSLLKEKNINDHKNIAQRPIQALNQKWADLFIFSGADSVSEYEKLLLDRTATALAQNTLRELYFEEQRKTIEAEWIQKWLDGIHNENQIHQYLADYEPNMNANGCVVLLLRMNQPHDNHNDRTHLKILFRSIFESLGFSLFTKIGKNHLIFILVNKRNEKDVKVRISSGISQIQKATESLPQVAVGRFVHKLSEANNSYHTAEETLFIQERSPNESYFYDDLYIYRLFSMIREQRDLEIFIQDYIGSVIEYDKENNGKLLDTLKIYFKCNGSKKETASNLFIVRQTLYQRLHKLTELLGKDFLESHKRQAIEFAITAFDYLAPK